MLKKAGYRQGQHTLFIGVLLLLAIGIVGFPSVVFASQFAEDDFQIWPTVSLKLSPGEKIDLNITAQPRIGENAQEISQWFMQSNVQWHATQHLSLEAGHDWLIF